MKTLFTFFSSLISVTLLGNINYIELNKIPNNEKYTDRFNYLKNNEKYYNHWQQDWTYNVSQSSMVKELKEDLDLFQSLDNENLEVNLLLGDISHYLYNLHEDQYFDYAEKFYKKAMNISPNDYRTYWFIANHYALSNVLDKAIFYYMKSKEILPKDEPAEFWEDYSFATAVANMPSNCIFSMDRSKSILGEPSNFEKQLGQTILKRIVSMKSDSTYSYKDIWTYSQDDLITFICRPLGLKLLIDSTWQINFYDYQNNQSAVSITPPAIKDLNGKDITYSIAIIMKVAKTGDNLDDFINYFVSKYTNKRKFQFSDKYSGILSYEIKDKDMYKNIGGAHMHMIGIIRNKPKYPGLLLEEPVILPRNKSQKVTYYRSSESQDRFNGEIYYAIMLDACENIYQQAFDLFKKTFEEQIIIE